MHSFLFIEVSKVKENHMSINKTDKNYLILLPKIYVNHSIMNYSEKVLVNTKKN